MNLPDGSLPPAGNTNERRIARTTRIKRLPIAYLFFNGGLSFQRQRYIHAYVR